MKSFLLLVLVAIQISCLRLDDNLFEPVQITEYLFDDYQGEVDFRLNGSYDIDDSLIYPFTFSSFFSGEPDAKTIYAVYIGNIDII